MSEPIENQVSYIRGIFRDVTNRNRHSRAMELEDHRFYSAINHGQWTQTAIDRLQEQGRPIITWNYIKKHIDTETGMLLQNPFEFNFASEMGQKDEDAELMNELRYRDKDLGRWPAEKSKFVTDFLINTGVMEIYIDRTKDRMGAINYRRRIATDFHFDPDWRSDSVQDNQQIFIANYFNIVKIIEDYGNTIDKKIEIKQAHHEWVQNRQEVKSQSMSMNGSAADTRSAFMELPETLNGKFLVIQMEELEDIKVNKLFNRSTGTFLKDSLDDAADEDRALMFQALQEQEGSELVEIPTPEKKLIVKTIAPGLSHNLFLANGLHEIQIGNYPYTVASAYNNNGQRYGKVSQYKDPQAVFNKSKSIILQNQSLAGNENKLIGPGAFNDPEDKQKYTENRSRGGGNFDVDDVNQIKNDESGQLPTDSYRLADDAIAFLDKNGAALASQGQAKSGTSGVLFNAEREQAAVGLEGLNHILEKIENDQGEQYVDLGMTHYGDDVARRFKSLKDDKDVFINADEATRISNMTRMSVRIDQAPVGTSIKRENLQLISQLKNAAQTPLEVASLAVLQIPLIPGISEANKEAMLKDAEQALETARVQDQALRAQAQAAIQQTGGQPQAGPEGEEQTQTTNDPELESLIQAAGGDQLPQGSETQGII